jgi:hypothetical protein
LFNWDPQGGAWAYLYLRAGIRYFSCPKGTSVIHPAGSHVFRVPQPLIHFFVLCIRHLIDFTGTVWLITHPAPVRWRRGQSRRQPNLSFSSADFRPGVGAWSPMCGQTEFGEEPAHPQEWGYLVVSRIVLRFSGWNMVHSGGPGQHLSSWNGQTSLSSVVPRHA